MADPRNDDQARPLAERGTRRKGADVGGMASTADAGLADATQRSMERRDEDPTGGATLGEGMGGTQSAGRTDLGGKNAPGSAPGAARPSRRADSVETTPRPGRPAVTERTTTGRVRSANAGRTASGRAAEGHEIDEPRDEGPVESLGRAVGDVVLGSDEEDRKARESGR